jgi:hypothetical protein
LNGWLHRLSHRHDNWSDRQQPGMLKHRGKTEALPVDPAGSAMLT